MKCPRCGFDQPEDIYCVQCGVDMEKWQTTHKGKVRRIELYLAGAGVLIVAVIIALIVFSGKGSGQKDATVGPITIDDGANPNPPAQPAPTPPGTTPTTPEIGPTTPIAPPTQPGKIISDEKTAKSLNADVLTQLVAPDKAIEQQSRKGFRLFAARDGQMYPIPFQIDADWTQPADGNWRGGDKILVMASDLGGRDDHAYPPQGYNSFSRAEVKGKQGLGWAYLFHFDYPPAPLEKSYIKFSKSPDDVSGRHYKLRAASDHPAALGQLSLGSGPNLLDRQKIRIVTHDNVWNESFTDGQYSLVISGPLLARTRWTGTIMFEKTGVPLVVENEYWPDGWKTTYALDFTGADIADAVMRIYFDFKKGDDIKMVTPDRLQGFSVDGKMDDAERAPTGQWYLIAAPGAGIKVSTTASGAKLFYMDDATREDAPESESGCFGCAGFEFKVTGSMLFSISYDVVPDYKLGAAPGDLSPLKGSLLTIETR